MVEEEEEDKQGECEEYQSFFRDVIGHTFVIACFFVIVFVIILITLIKCRQP